MVTAAAVIVARLVDKLDGLQAGTLSIRTDRSDSCDSILVTLDLKSSLRTVCVCVFFFRCCFYLFTTTFDPTNNCGKFYLYPTSFQ